MVTTYSEHLSDLLMFVDINVEVLHLALLCLHCVDEHRFELVAGAAPSCTRLDHSGRFAVLQSVLPITVRFHFLDVAWLVAANGGGLALITSI